MLKWEFAVSGQTLTRTDRLNTYADMVGQLQASFALDSWWDDYIITAQFVRDGIADLRVLQNGICDVPDRVLAGAGIVYVSLYAVDGSTRKTTNEIYIKIEPSGIRRGSLSPSKPSGDVWQQTLRMLNGLQGGQKGQIPSKASDSDYDFDFVDLPEDTPKIQKYTIDAEEYYSKTPKPIIDFSEREVGNGIFDVDIAVRVKLVDDVFDNPTPIFSNPPISYEGFSNPPISYEGDVRSLFIFADLKEIMLYFEMEVENEDTGEMELEELRLNASTLILIRIFGDDLKVPIEFEANDGKTLSATISAHYKGLDNDTVSGLRDGIDFYNGLLKKATLYYVPYEMGDETIAEVSI